jgi:acyl-CoA synthetase (NDP forming)
MKNRQGTGLLTHFVESDGGGQAPALTDPEAWAIVQYASDRTKIPMNDAMKALLTPRSIAILGASANFNKLNGRTLKALLDKQYSGKIYPVNPKYTEIGGLKCYPDLAAVTDEIDLAVVAVPAKFVPQTIRELGARNVKAAVVFSSGFSEIGGDGVERERDLRAAIKESGVRVLGPNCLGLINAFENVMATFTQFSLGPTAVGPAALVTQSGALGTATAGVARKRGIHFGYFVNTGNELDVNFVDVMREVLADERIKVGAGFMEGLKDSRGLLALAGDALATGKPIIITKVGRTSAGARAIASHTGSLAGTDVVFADVIRQYGIVRSRSDEELINFVDAFTTCGLPEGRGIGILTRSGGAGALMADRAEELGLDVARLSADTLTELKKIVPTFGSTANPVDITAQGLVDPSLMRNALKIMLADPSVHVGIAWLSFTEKEADTTVRTFAEVKAESSKPFVVAWPGIPDRAVTALREAGVSLYSSAEPAIEALAALVRYGDARRRWQADDAARNSLRPPKLELPRAAGAVSTLEGARLLEACGVKLARAELARNADEAAACAARLGYPVVLKIESPDILHKTEAQGVKLGLKDEAAVKAAYAEIMASAKRYKSDAKLDGVIVQPMAEGHVELVIGLKDDPVFGVIVMVGLGGILVEVLKDVSFRKAPVTRAEAGRMLDDLKGRAILDGVRGKPAVDREALTNLISAVSLFGAAAEGRLAELDLNPVLSGAHGATAVDWLMMLQE